MQMRTVHHAVQCMDMFISQKAKDTKEGAHMVVTQEQYKLCAATCVLIASKSFERDDLIPKSH